MGTLPQCGTWYSAFVVFGSAVCSMLSPQMRLGLAAGLEMADFMRRQGDAAFCTEMIAQVARDMQETYLAS